MTDNDCNGIFLGHLNIRRMLTVSSDQLLNLTISKSGLQSIKRLLNVFNDARHENLPNDDPEHQPTVTIENLTGQVIAIENLKELQVSFSFSIEKERSMNAD